MNRELFVSLGLLGLLAGCREPYVSPAPPMRREVATGPVTELAPQPGTAARTVLDGGRPIADEPKIGIVTAANSVAQFDPYMQYDKTTEITLRGHVVGFRRVPLRGDRTGLFVRLTVGGELPYVYLGPEQWLFLHDINPGMTDQILVTGSRAELNGRTVMMARKVVWNGLEVHVRDANGSPYWSEPVVRDPAAEERLLTEAEKPARR